MNPMIIIARMQMFNLSRMFSYNIVEPFVFRFSSNFIWNLSDWSTTSSKSTGMEKYHLDLVINKNMKYMYSVLIQMFNTLESLSVSITVNNKKNAIIPTMWRKNALCVIRCFMSHPTMLDKNPNNNHKYRPAMAVLTSIMLDVGCCALRYTIKCEIYLFTFDILL